MVFGAVEFETSPSLLLDVKPTQDSSLGAQVLGAWAFENEMKNQRKTFNKLKPLDNYLYIGLSIKAISENMKCPRGLPGKALHYVDNQDDIFKCFRCRVEPLHGFRQDSLRVPLAGTAHPE